MDLRDKLIQRILSVSPLSFEALALDVFAFQYINNPVYHQFCQLMGRSPDKVLTFDDIPHLPIALYKHNLIQTNVYSPQIVFESSTTTGQTPSRHAVRSLELYQKVARKGFNDVFQKDVSSMKWFGLLPSYLERPNASLVFMVRDFIAQGGGGFYISDFAKLKEEIVQCEKENITVVLIGVTFALLDFAAFASLDLKSTLVIETGGMKGRRQEMTRSELHGELKSAFGVDQIYSEYGMTELLSQSWTKGGDLFYPSNTTRIHTREIMDPMAKHGIGKRGAINVTDLANIDSCAFIATDDAGVLNADGSFEVLGRLDGSEQRGCSLMFRR